MPVPTLITDLSTTIASNSPAGSEVRTTADDYFRAFAAFIAQLRDGPKDLTLGTAAAPSLAFTGDLNTGIYSPAADQIALAAGGVQRVAANTTGAAITGALTVSTTVTATGLVKGNNGGAGLGQITVSTSAASGGAAGDLWFQRA